MQPYTRRMAEEHLSTQAEDIAIGKCNYRAVIEEETGYLRETGPDGEKKYPIVHVMGGKNVYYFLTPMERGRLQVLPLAYDVRKKTWYDTAASGVRHFPDRQDTALEWTDKLFTFNSACFNCHVSQLRTNYDLQTDTYNTTWSEPGISCESCHGPASEHNKIMASAGDEKIDDVKIIRTKGFTASQMNDMCATCHAKLVPLSLDFRPGNRFFDHFDLQVWDHPDYYPDGRDLGENYTYTSWLRSPCAQSGKLDCNYCHTSSGRMRFSKMEINKSCSPCHDNYVSHPELHGHHQPGSEGNSCVGCHMPMTRFAAMGRTDHSMLPPTPRTTIAFQSPNACNICHADKDAAWSEEWVKKWYPRDYESEVVRRAELVDQARKQEWKRLPEMLEELKKLKNDPVFVASLVRLLRNCEEEQKWPVVAELLHHESPLVRSSAVATLGDRLTPETIPLLVEAAGDETRVVRIRAAMALAALDSHWTEKESDREKIAKATREFMAAMKARPDDWSSYANLGNFYMERRDFTAAARNFEIAATLDPRRVGPSVNASIAYSNLGQTDKAEKTLLQALQYEPNNAAALYNLGLLRGEQNRLPEAEKSLRAALASDPKMHAAAYNLGILVAEKNLDEAVQWCRKAHDIRPREPKYALTLAFYLNKKGEKTEAIALLSKLIEDNPLYGDAYLLLGGIYEEQKDFVKAVAVYKRAVAQQKLPKAIKDLLDRKIQSLETK